jgi:hypothetical protein
MTDQCMDPLVATVACNALFYSITSVSTYISSTQNIFRFILEHKDSSYAVFQHQIEQTDLITRMNIVVSLIKQIVSKYVNLTNLTNTTFECLSGDWTVIDMVQSPNLEYIPEPTRLAIISVLTTIAKINTVLEIIYMKIKTHQLSYMKAFVKIKIVDDIAQIETLTALFEKRVDLLLRIC